MEKVKITKLLEIEGLRAILALWVVISHFLSENGIRKEALEGPALLLRNGYLAVCVFMILSGFVIALTIDVKKETYGVFAIRRFFRLFPVLAVILIIASGLSYLAIELKAMGVFKALYSSLGGHFKNEIARFPEYFLTHIGMIHGIIPDQLLPRSTEALVVPAWSISVEWQFYLIAPFLFLALTKKGHILSSLLLLVLGIISIYYFEEIKKTFGIGAVVTHLHWFLIGIVSYQLFKNEAVRAQIGKISGVALLIIATFFLSPGFKQFWSGIVISISIWSIFFIALCNWHSSELSQSSFEPIRRILLSDLVQKIGQSSYSIYLIHWPIIGLCLAIFSMDFLKLPPQIEMIFTFIIVIVITYLAGITLYRFVEKKGIALGNYVVEKTKSKNNQN